MKSEMFRDASTEDVNFLEVHNAAHTLMLQAKGQTTQTYRYFTTIPTLSAKAKNGSSFKRLNQ
jgi:hypothetical protein